MSGRFVVLTRGAFTTPTLSLFLVVVIAALTYLGLAAPVLLADGRTATVQRAVVSLPDLSRWPTATTPGLPIMDETSNTESGVWGSALAAVEQKREEQPEPLRSLLGPPRMTVTVDPQLTLDENPERTSPVPSNRVGLVSDPGLIDRAELVEGRLPELTDPADGIEIVLTETVAEQLAWRTGTERQSGGTTLTLTGLVAPSGSGDGDWAFIGGSSEALVEVSANGDRILVAFGFMHVDEAAALVDRVGEIKTTAWMPFDAAALDAATAQQVAAQLRLLSADPVAMPMFDATFFNRGLPLSSSVPQAIDEGIVRAEAMAAVVTVAAVGPAAVAAVVLALVSRLIAVRRTASRTVLRARGASTSRLITLLGGEGAVLGVLGAMIGAGAAAATPGWGGPWIFLVPMVLAAVPAVTVPWAALTDAEQHGRRDIGGSGRRGAGRMAVEALVLAVTVVLAVLIVARGGVGGVDPLLLALTLLLGAAGSIVTLRLLPALLRVAERRSRRRASLTALLGPARARRDPVMRTGPVLAIVVGLAVATFSVAFGATVSEGIARSAAVNVGADVRVDAPYITPAAADRVAELDGVVSMAALSGDATVEASAGSTTERVHVYTIDRDDFVAVQSDAGTALALPPELTESADRAVPVVVSNRLLERLGLDEGEEREFELSDTRVRVVGTAPSQVPFGSAELWVIVDAVHAEAIGSQSTGLSQLYLALQQSADPGDVGAAAVAALGNGAAFETPAQVSEVHAGDPALVVVRAALLSTSALVAVLLAVGVVATLVLGAPSRARMLAILRALGQPNRAAGRLVTWEVAPALLLALPFGIGAGIAMAWLVIPQLELRGFVGGSEQPPVALGGAWQLVIVAGFVCVAAVAVLVATMLASRLGEADAIRADDERVQ